MTEDEMVGWHHWLDRHEFEQALGVGDGQGGLVCCSWWGRNESDMTERLNWPELVRTYCIAQETLFRALWWPKLEGNPKRKAAAAAAKSLQLCPILCDPIDSSPPGSSVHGIFQARVLEWGAIAFSEKGRHLCINIADQFSVQQKFTQHCKATILQ